ncbi:MAG: hypothetical protein JJE21_09335 [Spirochaetaceae bacterium]|nr:hypothetical protein [Spirochaetaceae bacterium]
MFEWNNKSIKWFCKASKSSEFHKKLALIIKDLIHEDSSILDIGAGLGFLDRELINYCKLIALVEPDKNAFSFLLDNEMPNLKLYNKNWQDYKNDNKQKMDYLLLSFFSRMDKEDNLSDLLELCTDSIIYVRNENHAENDDLINYLNLKNVSYNYKHYNLDFSQPLIGDEIEDFFDTYYQRKNKTELLKKIVKINDGYLYKNNKSISIFVIKNKNNEESK